MFWLFSSYSTVLLHPASCAHNTIILGTTTTIRTATSWGAKAQLFFVPSAHRQLDTLTHILLFILKNFIILNFREKKIITKNNTRQNRVQTNIIAGPVQNRLFRLDIQHFIEFIVFCCFCCWNYYNCQELICKLIFETRQNMYILLIASNMLNGLIIIKVHKIDFEMWPILMAIINHIGYRTKFEILTIDVKIVNWMLRNHSLSMFDRCKSCDFRIHKIRKLPKQMLKLPIYLHMNLWRSKQECKR